METGNGRTFPRWQDGDILRELRMSQEGGLSAGSRRMSQTFFKYIRMGVNIHEYSIRKRFRKTE